MRHPQGLNKIIGKDRAKHGVRPNPDAVEFVSKRKAPRTDTQSMSFVGFANYYTKSVKEYAD